MWTRAELKERAKAALKPYYWWGVLACFVAGLLGGGTGGGGFGFSGNFGRSYSSSGYGMDQQTMQIIMALMVVIIIIALLGAAFGVFVSSVVQVGKVYFFLESRYRGESAGISSIFFGFSSGKYLNIVKIMFFRGLYVFLWSLLLFIPGIIKSYEYYMVPYLLADEPTLDRKEAFRLSKEMMYGHKFDTWVLELSFTGWYLLGLLACCMGGIFVNPYYEATFVELYLKLKENIFGPPQQQQPQDAEPVYIDYVE